MNPLNAGFLVNPIKGNNVKPASIYLLNEGTSLVYLCAFIGFAILMGGISLACLKLPESGIDHAINIYPLFLPRRPVISMLRMYSYILRPATVKELDPAPADEYAF